MGTVLVLHKRNKMQHKNRPYVPSVTNPFLFVSDCPASIPVLLNFIRFCDIVCGGISLR